MREIAVESRSKVTDISGFNCVTEHSVASYVFLMPARPNHIYTADKQHDRLQRDDGGLINIIQVSITMNFRK